ncbi:MAG: FtsX-like permease family protein [Vicinamibacterales bacterium]
MLTRASLRFYAATHVMVVLGVAVAVAVLAGALLVGASVRESLKQIALGRLGATDVVITSPTFFRTALADALMTRSTQPQQTPLGNRVDPYRVLRSAAPLVVFGGAVVHDESRRTAGTVMAYGIDERFGRFHGIEGFDVTGREALISAALAQEVGAAAGDSLTLRVAKPSDIPLSSLQGRRETTGERIRVTVARVLDDASLGEFSLAPAQGAVFAIYVPMGRLQRDLGLGDRANTILLSLSGTADVDPARLISELITPVAALDDLGLRVRSLPSGSSPATAPSITVVETRAGLLTDDLVTTIEDLAASDRRRMVPALTYVANAIRIGDRAVPYSTVSAVDLDGYNRLAGTVGPSEPGNPKGLPPQNGTDPTGGGNPSGLPDAGTPAFSNHPPIWLNEWAAQDLQARIGDAVTLDYFLWSDADGMTTSSATFTLVGITPMAGIGGDPTLTPDYPGISDAADMTSWDPPFPVELKRIRTQDEDYWDRYRAAPKAIISMAEGQRLWGSRYGSVSSVRLSGNQPVAPQSVPPAAAGFTARAVRSEALSAAQGTTDFGEYFLYFSFFLVVSALLLAYLFFAVGLEQRTREVGLLATVGFAPAAIRAAFVREGAVLAAAGAVIGIGAAIGYAAIIMYGLRTWWVGAVGTTRLTLHVAPQWLAIGAIGALAAGVLAIWIGVRQMSRRSARSLLKGEAGADRAGGAGRAGGVAIAFALLGVALIIAATSGALNPTAGFFGAGGAWLVAGLTGASAWLRRRRPSRPLTRGLTGMSQLGFRHTAVHPSRSVLSLALIAFACFVLVSVGAFRKQPAAGGDKASGTGGFMLMAESVAPLMYDPNTAEGRSGLAFESNDPILAGAQVTRFRLRPGDETSCLTLYRPTNPRIIAPGPGFTGDARFSFAASMATTPEEQANPWTLLGRTFDDGAIAAVADQTTLMYVLHLGIGDDFEFTPEGQPPVRLRIVGALADSVLQSELIIGEADFVRLFPRHEGYRLWMIDTAPANAAAVTSHLEDRLSDYGLDVTNTLDRWASYHQVENTYLATFQALGSLGLLLGTVGLGAVLARNVLERRRDLGLLSAVGFTPANVRSMVLSEGLALVVAGTLLGATCAIVAVWPAVQERAQAVPIGSLSMLLSAVVATGVVSSLFAVRLATATSVVQAIKGE